MIAGRSHVWKMQKQPFLVRMGGLSILGEGGIKIFRTGGYRFWGYFCSIQKVLEQLWRYFTFLKLCKCSWMLHPLPTVASTPIGTKTNHHWFLSSSSTPHTLIGTTPIQEGQRKSFPALDLHKKILNSIPTTSFLINTRSEKRQNLGFTHHLHFLW